MSMRILITTLSAMVLTAAILLSKTVPLAPKESDVVGTWVGFTSEANNFYRIVLRKQGGLLAQGFGDAAPALYRIESWSLDTKSKLSIRTSQISTNAYPMRAEGSATTSRLDLKFMGMEGGWMREVSMHREDLIKRRITALESAMQEIK